MAIINRFKKFYNASAENRAQFFLVLGFIVVPTVGMSLLYVIVSVFLLNK